MMDFKKESTQGTVKPNLLEVQLGQSGGGMSFGTKINNGLKKINIFLSIIICVVIIQIK